jgi:hypothetical protein
MANSPDKWDLNILRDGVEVTYGRAQRELLEPSLNSLPIRQEYAKYHYRRAQELLRPYLDKVQQPHDAVELLFGFQDGKRVPFEMARNEASANYLACLLVIHSFGDNLAHVLYFGLALNLDPGRRLSDRAINIGNVSDKLDNHPDARDCLLDVARGGNAAHLSALSNISKHRSVISAQFGASLVEDEGKWHGMRFPAVQYCGSQFPTAWVDEFLKDEFGRQSNLILRIGAQLNAFYSDRD